jgi:hypothetical protein
MNRSFLSPGKQEHCLRQPRRTPSRTPSIHVISADWWLRQMIAIALTQVDLIYSWVVWVHLSIVCA